MKQHEVMPMVTSDCNVQLLIGVSHMEEIHNINNRNEYLTVQFLELKNCNGCIP